MIDLRPYQRTALSSLRSSLAGGVKRPLLYSPTGSGKTEMALAMVEGAMLKGKRVAFLCNRIALVEQSSKRFTRSGVAHGVIQGANTFNPLAPVIVASIQTVARRGLAGVDLLIIDEAHGVAGSQEYRELLFRYNNVPTVGLTATPFAKGLGKHYDQLGGPLFEALVVAATIPELVADGYLVDCDIYAPSEPDLTGVKTKRDQFGDTDWVESDLAEAVDKPELVGDIVSHWLRLADNSPTVCFATSVQHSKHIVESFRAVGVVAEHIDGYMDQPERKAIMERVTKGATKVISNCNVLSEGWDYPACRTLILARPTKSLTRYIQMAGRVLRPAPDKTRALILDHSGSVRNLGFPTDDLPLVLDDGKPKQVSAKEADPPKPTVCMSCAIVKPPKCRVCPGCGFAAQRELSVIEVDGELAKVKRKKPTMQDKQQFWSELLAIASIKGRSEGWASHAYRDYFGVWPKGLADYEDGPSQETLDWVRHKDIRFAKSKEKRNAA